MKRNGGKRRTAGGARRDATRTGQRADWFESKASEGDGWIDRTAGKGYLVPRGGGDSTARISRPARPVVRLGRTNGLMFTVPLRGREV